MKVIVHLSLIIIVILLSSCQGKESTTIFSTDAEVNSTINEVEILKQQLIRTEETYFLRNEVDITAYTFFSAILNDNDDVIPDLLSENTSIDSNEMITVNTDSNTMTYDLSWIRDVRSNLDYIRQRAYFLEDDNESFFSIYEFKSRPDQKGEYDIGVVHVEFRKENNQWKIFHLYDDI